MALSDVQTIIDNAIQVANSQIELVDSYASAGFFAYNLGDIPKPLTTWTNLSGALGNESVPDISFPKTITIPQWQRYGQQNGGDPLEDDIISIIKDLNQFSVQYGIDAIGPKLVSLFSTYLSTFYPNFVNESVGIDDLIAILANKGYSQPVPAESAIFQRGRDRALLDGQRAESQAIVEWSQRGFSMPPGALMQQQMMLRQSTQDKVSQIASDIVVSQDAMAVEFYKFAIQQTLAYREKAFDSAVAYLQVFTTSVMKGFGADAYAAILNARNQMFGTTLDLYKAMSANRQAKFGIKQTDNAQYLEGWKSQMGVFSELTRAQSSASIGAANAVGHVAAAAMAGVNAAASITDASSS